MPYGLLIGESLEFSYQRHAVWIEFAFENSRPDCRVILEYLSGLRLILGSENHYAEAAFILTLTVKG